MKDKLLAIAESVLENYKNHPLYVKHFSNPQPDWSHLTISSGKVGIDEKLVVQMDDPNYKQMEIDTFYVVVNATIEGLIMQATQKVYKTIAALCMDGNKDIKELVDFVEKIGADKVFVCSPEIISLMFDDPRTQSYLDPEVVHRGFIFDHAANVGDTMVMVNPLFTHNKVFTLPRNFMSFTVGMIETDKAVFFTLELDVDLKSPRCYKVDRIPAWDPSMPLPTY